jgi:hypothetical protein
MSADPRPMQADRPPEGQVAVSLKEFAAILVLSGALGIGFVYSLAIILAFVLGVHLPPIE